MTLITKALAFIKSDLVRRTVKTVGAVLAAEAASYTTIVPNPPGTNTSLALAGGAGVATFLLNAAIQWFVKVKSARLDKLAAAIDAIVDKRITEQAMAKAAEQVPPAG